VREARCKRITGSSDLSNIQAKFLKIWAESLKTGAKCLKIGAKMAPSVFLISKHCAQRPNVKDFFWRSCQQKVFMIFVGENLQAKSHKNLSGKFRKIRAKILRTPKNLPAPTLMVWTFANKPQVKLLEKCMTLQFYKNLQTL